MNVIEQLKTATLGYDHITSGICTAGITIGDHKNAIEINATTPEDADKMREYILRKLWDPGSSVPISGTVMESTIFFPADATFKQKVQTLLDGKILFMCGAFYRMVDTGLEYATSIDDPEWRSCKSVDIHLVIKKCNNVIYKEVEKAWYKHIPQNGVLCWTNKGNTQISRIVGYNTGMSCPYNDGELVYDYAVPLTVDEILSFIYG